MKSVFNAQLRCECPQLMMQLLCVGAVNAKGFQTQEKREKVMWEPTLYAWFCDGDAIHLLKSSHRPTDLPRLSSVFINPAEEILNSKV